MEHSHQYSHHRSSNPTTATMMRHNSTEQQQQQPLQLHDDGKSVGSAASSSKPQQQPRSSSLKQFPGKLHDLLTYAEMNGLDNIIGWVHNGSAFMVHDQEKLLQVLPIFFGQTKFRSFQRQLNVSTTIQYLVVVTS
jgi:HSF-type DNA-binding